MIFLKYIPSFGIRRDGFSNFRTSRYKLNFYETPSGMKFIMTTDLTVGNIRDILHQIYSNVSTCTCIGIIQLHSDILHVLHKIA